MRKHGKLKSSKNTVSGKLSPGKFAPGNCLFENCPLQPKKMPSPEKLPRYNCPPEICPSMQTPSRNFVTPRAHCK